MKTTDFIEKLNQLDFISEVTESSELKQITIFVNYRMTVTIATEELFTFNLMQASFNQLLEPDQITLYNLLTEYVATPLNEREDSRARLNAMGEELEERLGISSGCVVTTYSKIHNGVICLYLGDSPIMIYVDMDVITFPSTDGEELSIPINKLLAVVSYVQDHLDELHELWALTRKHDHETKQEHRSESDEDLWDEWKKVIDEYWGE